MAAATTVTERVDGVEGNRRTERFKVTGFSGGGPSSGYVQTKLAYIESVKVEERQGQARTVLVYPNKETTTSAIVSGSVHFTEVDADNTILEVTVKGW